MARFGFCNGSYTSQSPNVDAEQTINMYPENPESPGAKTAVAMYLRPGKKLFCSLIGPSVRGGISFNGLCYAVSGATFYQIFANGTSTVLGTVASDNNPVIFTAGPSQILFCSAGTMYVWNYTTNVLFTVPQSTLAPANALVTSVTYIDGFFIAQFSNSGQFQVSNPDDATTWPLLDTAIVSVFPDNIVSMVRAYRQIFFLGQKESVAYYDSGAPIQPMAPVSGGFIETGSVATYGGCFMDGSPFWLGQDERGAGIAWRANQYNPQRVSTFATEFAWAQYPTIADAISYTYQEQGHTFWMLYFPTANATWGYDAASGQWHQRGFWQNGVFTADRARCHFFAFGQHLVGDWASGNIYTQAIGIYNDFGNPLRWVRRAPTVSTELEWTFHHQMQVDLESGLGPLPPLLDGSGNPRDPIVSLRWSDDGGHSWSNSYDKGIGQAGNYTKRVIWRRLGRSRQRIYELSGSDPVAYRIVDAYLKASPNYDTAERYSAQIRKIS